MRGQARGHLAPRKRRFALVRKKPAPKPARKIAHKPAKKPAPKKTVLRLVKPAHGAPPRKLFALKKTAAKAGAFVPRARGALALDARDEGAPSRGISPFEQEQEPDESPSESESEVGPDDEGDSSDSGSDSGGDDEGPGDEGDEGGGEEEPAGDDDEGDGDEAPESDESEEPDEGDGEEEASEGEDVGALVDLSSIDPGKAIVLGWVLFGVTLSSAMAIGWAIGRKRYA